MMGKLALTSGFKRTVCLFLSFFVVSCASNVPPIIASREAPPSQRINFHEVQPGETLYSIAWRYDTDYRDMERINGLSEPYNLRLGQRLKIYDDGQPAPNSNSAPVVDRSSTVRTVPIDPQSDVYTSSDVDVSSDGSTSPDSNRPVPQVPVSNEIDGWRWPISGRVTSAFGSNSLTKGIEIDPGTEKNVRSAADGEVVYAGAGIRGVGNLIIVKHSELYLSAYAYNSNLLVEEGQRVNAGETIARAGNDSNGRPRVYFEIRKDGQSVDPTRYLPTR